MEKIYENIRLGREVRKNLIALRSTLSDEDAKRRLAYMLGGSFDTFTDLLTDPDPKIRKNAALILGEMETEDVLPFLFAAYQKEETMYVRADYLKAMRKMNSRRYADAFRVRRDQLLREENDAAPENRKHIREELLALDALLQPYEKTRRHAFTGIGADPEQDDILPAVLLVTGSEQREVTAGSIHTGEVKLLHSAVRVLGGSARELLSVRTYRELLFPLPVKEPLRADTPEKLGKALGNLKIAAFLDQFHEGEGAYRYRLDIRGGFAGQGSKQDPAAFADRGKMLRKVSEALDQTGRGTLLNSVSDYEIEIRLLARKDGGYVPMLKLMTIPDKRFAYRREVTADSIAPFAAAAAVELARPYLRDRAQVLDPFCGTGTMLIERRYALGAADTYGVDYLGEAVEKARINTQITGMRINYVQRDFFDFRHDYRFDEVISNMPSGGGREMDPETFYDRFFLKLPELLNHGAVLVLITTRSDLVKRYAAAAAGYRIREKYVLNEKTNSCVLILTYGGRNKEQIEE